VRLLCDKVSAVPEALHRCDARIFFLITPMRTQVLKFKINMSKKKMWAECVNYKRRKKSWFNRRSQRPAVGMPGSWPLDFRRSQSLPVIVSLHCNISLVQHFYALFIIKLIYYRKLMALVAVFFLALRLCFYK